MSHVCLLLCSHTLTSSRPCQTPLLCPHTQGGLDDGSSVELSLEVSAVDLEERASAWDLPLLKAPATTTSTVATQAVIAPTAAPPSDPPPAASAIIAPGHLPGVPPAVEQLHIGKLHVMVHGVELDAIEYSKPIDCFFLLK